jgi:hypothetical protein
MSLVSELADELKKKGTARRKVDGPGSSRGTFAAAGRQLGAVVKTHVEGKFVVGEVVGKVKKAKTKSSAKAKATANPRKKKQAA